MPLINMKEILVDARENHYAVPLFDTPSVNSAIGVIRAAERTNAPVILGMYDQWFEYPEAHGVCAGLRTLAEGASVPVSLMLDHGKDFKQCIKAILYGFTDVMFDGSALSVEENMRVTKLICEAAKGIDVGVEAELGHVGWGNEYEEADVKSNYTKPGVLEQFIIETGVDFLAVAIGTAHGDYKSTPKLDLDLLTELNAISTVPLVLHGGSGLSEDQFRGSIDRGIAKVNVATHIFNTFAQRIADASAKGVIDIYTIEAMERDTFEEVCSYYLKLFRAAGRG